MLRILRTTYRKNRNRLNFQTRSFPLSFRTFRLSLDRTTRQNQHFLYLCDSGMVKSEASLMKIPDAELLVQPENLLETLISFITGHRRELSRGCDFGLFEFYS